MQRADSGFLHGGGADLARKDLSHDSARGLAERQPAITGLSQDPNQGSGRKRMWRQIDLGGLGASLAGRAGGKDAVRLLGVSATIVDIGVGEGGGPHHDSAEGRVAAVVANQSCQRAWLEVVLSTAGRAGGAIGGSRHTDEDLGVGGRGVGNVGDPGVVVDGPIHGAAGVIVELDPEIVELGVGDNNLHVGLGNGALRRASDVVGIGGIGSKVGAERADHILIVLVAAGGLDIEIPTVHEDITEGTGHGAIARVAVGIPEVLADSLGLLLRLQRVRTNGSTEGQNNLDAGRLACLDS